jgi:hypothetical protein
MALSLGPFDRIVGIKWGSPFAVLRFNTAWWLKTPGNPSNPEVAVDGISFAIFDNIEILTPSNVMSIKSHPPVQRVTPPPPDATMYSVGNGALVMLNLSTLTTQGSGQVTVAFWTGASTLIRENEFVEIDYLWDTVLQTYKVGGFDKFPVDSENRPSGEWPERTAIKGFISSDDKDHPSPNTHVTYTVDLATLEIT